MTHILWALTVPASLATMRRTVRLAQRDEYRALLRAALTERTEA